MNTFDAWNEMEKERKQRKENAPCSEWISVKERLPEVRHSVLVYCPYNKCIYTAYYDDFNDEWYYFGYGGRNEVYYTVSHWMPLPEPPEEGGGECDHLIEGRYHDRMLRKCEVYGMTHSEASDWAKRWRACGLFNKETNHENVIRLVGAERGQPAEPLEGQIGLEMTNNG